MEISSTALPSTPELSVSVAGLKTHRVFDGSVPHAKMRKGGPLGPVGVIMSV